MVQIADEIVDTFDLANNFVGSTWCWTMRQDLVVSDVEVLSAWGFTLNDVMATSDAVAYAYRPGRVIEEVINLLEGGSYGVKYNALLTDAYNLIGEIDVASPALATDSIVLTSATAIAIGVKVLDGLEIIDADSTTATFVRSLTDAFMLDPVLTAFIGKTVTDTILVTDGVTQAYLPGATVNEIITLTETLQRRFIIRMDLADGVILGNTDSLSQILSASLTDGVMITAGFMSSSGEFTTWAVNARTGATSEYTNYEFNSFAMVGNRYVGASPLGIFELAGDDDAGTDIIASLKNGWMQFGGSKFSSFKGAYLGVRGGGEFVLKIVTGDGKTYNYSVTAESMKTTRVQMGKGLRARYFSFELISTGQDFDLDSIEFIPLVAQRRV